VLGQISSGVITLDPDGIVRTINESAVSILGDELRDLIGQHIADGAKLSLLTGHVFYSLEGQRWRERMLRVQALSWSLMT